MFITFGNKTPFLYSMSLRTLFSGGLSLSSRLKLLTVLWVGSALLSVILTLILSLRLENAATVIDDAASLRMQVYRLAYMASERTPQAQIDNQLREFEGTLLRITQSDAIYPLMPSETPPAYGLIQSMLLIDWKSNIQPALKRYRRPTQIELYRFAGNIELFLQALENANEKNTLWLRRFQMAMMLMIFVAAGLMIVWHYAWIIRPLEPCATAWKPSAKADSAYKSIPNRFKSLRKSAKASIK